jgi:hypothetical protein
MTDIIKGIYSTFQEEINSIIRDVIYDTIPQGDVLKRASRQFKEPHCLRYFDGCNSCTGDMCTAMYCDEDMRMTPHCLRYKCEDPREDSIPITGEDTQVIPSNRVCGTYFNITKIGCTCKPEYQYRDKDSFKCVASC